MDQSVHLETIADLERRLQDTSVGVYEALKLKYNENVQHCTEQQGHYTNLKDQYTDQKAKVELQETQLSAHVTRIAQLERILQDTNATQVPDVMVTVE